MHPDKINPLLLEAITEPNLLPFQDSLLNLLALIHRDGGQHIHKTSLLQSVVDAADILLQERGTAHEAYYLLQRYERTLIKISEDTGCHYSHVAANAVLTFPYQQPPHWP